MILDFLEKLEKIDMSVVTQQVDSAELIVNCTIPDKLKDKINGVLKERLKRAINVKITQDPAIVSGALFKLGSLALDGSLKKMVEEEGTALKEKIEKS